MTGGTYNQIARRMKPDDPGPPTFLILCMIIGVIVVMRHTLIKVFPWLQPILEKLHRFQTVSYVLLSILGIFVVAACLKILFTYNGPDDQI